MTSQHAVPFVAELQTYCHKRWKSHRLLKCFTSLCKQILSEEANIKLVGLVGEHSIFGLEGSSLLKKGQNVKLSFVFFCKII
jgi:hypothetical protein